MCVSTGADMSHAPSIEQSAMVSGHDRSHSRGRDFGEGCGLFENGYGSYRGRQTVGDKRPR